MSRENADVVGRMFEALNRGVTADALSDEALATMFDPAIEMQQLADLAGTAGTFRGYEGLREAIREVNEGLMNNQYDLLEHASNGDKVSFVVKASGIGRASGVHTEMRVGHLFELRGGRIIRWVLYPKPEDALQAVAE